MTHKNRSLWIDSWNRLIQDPFTIFRMCIIFTYSLIAILASVGVLASHWNQEVAKPYSPPDFSSLATIMGTDIFGRSVFYKLLQGARIAMSVGLSAALISVPIGVVFGSLAGYFGGWLDEAITWFYTTLSSIPNILLLTAFTFILGKGLSSVYLALGLTSWVSLARLVRGEFLKHKNREYVLAAEALGAGHGSRIFKHILPNVFHVIIINFSLQFQIAIKTEVILSYLGLGAVGQPSWGIMIDDAKLELSRGVWWQLAAATLAMFLIVLAFNIFGDALRDSLDPKLKKR